MITLMDKHLISHPTVGMVSKVYYLKERGYPIGAKRIRRLFKLMGRQTIYGRKNLTKAGLREFKSVFVESTADHSCNQVWRTDQPNSPRSRIGF